MKALLLDTEVLIWWDANDRRLGTRARALIQEAEDVYVSAASAWEISIKVALGKLRTSRLASEAAADARSTRFRSRSNTPKRFNRFRHIMVIPSIA